MEDREMHYAKPRFDPTVNLGHLITFMGFILAALGGWYTIKGDVAILGTRIENMEQTTSRLTSTVERLTTVITTDARQDERITAMERRIDTNERRLEASRQK